MSRFRFGVTLFPIPDARPAWLDAVKAAEEAGFDIVTVMDHIRSGGIWSALVSAHHAAPSLRVGTLAVNTDFWHPALLAREAITADELTGGRLELGIGTGWDLEDYKTLGWARRPAGERLERLVETLDVLELAFAGGRVDYRGRHFTVAPDAVWPRTRQERVPILVGGGGPRILELAGRRAQIVSISRNLQRGSAASWQEGVHDAAAARVKWVSDAASGRAEPPELHTMLVKILPGNRQAGLEALSRHYSLSLAQVTRSPHFLAGSPAEMAADLLERRERLGISYYTVSGGNAAGDAGLEMMRAVIERVRSAEGT